MGLHKTKWTFENLNTKRVDGIRQDRQDRGIRQAKSTEQSMQDQEDRRD
jgi:hypothetical protein